MRLPGKCCNIVGMQPLGCEDEHHIVNSSPIEDTLSQLTVKAILNDKQIGNDTEDWHHDFVTSHDIQETKALLQQHHNKTLLNDDEADR